MSELTITRHFKADPAKVFDFLTQTQHLLEWWGPEGMHVPEHDLDLSREGPWFSVMRNSEGQNYKVSGHVTHVKPGKSVGFTWGWHDDADQRGHESHVTFAIAPAKGGGTDFTLTHAKLDAETAASHEQGWTSTLRKLEATLN